MVLAQFHNSGRIFALVQVLHHMHYRNPPLIQVSRVRHPPLVFVEWKRHRVKVAGRNLRLVVGHNLVSVVVPAARVERASLLLDELLFVFCYIGERPPRR